MTDPISRVTLELRVANEIDSVDTFLRKRGGDCATGSSVSLTFSRLKIFFITSYAACLLMLCVMVFYPLSRRQQKKSVEPEELTPPEQAAQIDSYSEASYSPEKL